MSDNMYEMQEQLKAAYALNMCTVSVSQIVDYNDEYILEQEYEAILNNLNLEQMPKDEALLNILVKLLNVITFFRIIDNYSQPPSTFWVLGSPSQMDKYFWSVAALNPEKIPFLCHTHPGPAVWNGEWNPLAPRSNLHYAKQSCM